MTWPVSQLLPNERDKTCDYTEIPYVDAKGYPIKIPASTRDPNTPGRCGQPAARVYRGTCGCGECDMTQYFCAAHAEEVDPGSIEVA